MNNIIKEKKLEISDPDLQSKRRNNNYNMHFLTNNIFNLPDYEISKNNNLSKRKLNISINSKSLKELNEDVKKINYHFLPSLKKQNKVLLPPIDDRNTNHENFDKKPEIVINNYDLFMKNRRLQHEKRNNSFNSEMLGIYKNISQVKQHNKDNLIHSFEIEKFNVTLDNRIDLSLLVDKKSDSIEHIPPISLLSRKPPLPPKTSSSFIQKKMSNCDHQNKIDYLKSNEHLKTDIEDRDLKSNELRDNLNCTDIDNISFQSHSNSAALKEKNFYDKNKNILKEKLLKSLDIQSKNHNFYIKKILPEENKKTRIIDDYIEKSINEKSEKDRNEELLSKNNKIINFKNYFKVIDEQLFEKKKKLESNNSYKNIMREIVDQESLENDLILNGFKEKDRLIKKNYREFLNNQILTNKNSKILKKVTFI